ncbi:MAG: hypothetical protein M1839_008387 [Geoglossum umbratile]|nr:MAG: hypothetical protein M1839_008387 [Geoglossum umbratile]
MKEQQPKKFLLVVTAGGIIAAAPILEIGRILSSRGHTVEFGTLEGRDHWLGDYPFIAKIHILGPAVPPDEEEASYLRLSHWSDKLSMNWTAVFDSKKFLMSSWPAVYLNLSKLMNDPGSRPDFIVADYLVEAVVDVNIEYGVPIARHWPRMPTALFPAPYIPGPAGLQIEVLTSEYATIWQRLRNELVMCFAFPHYSQYLRWYKQLRASVGVQYLLPNPPKPNYLCLVNSFFGVEVPKDLPPNVAAVGPILSDTFPPLTELYSSFLASHTNVLYVAFGTHALFRHESLYRVLVGVTEALAAGTVDGVIWSFRGTARRLLDATASIPFLAKDLPPRRIPISALLANQHPDIYFTEFAPQRALLEHPHTRIFLTHAGASSTNEAIFAGIPTITLPAYFDQAQYAMRLRDAGVSIPLSKSTFTSSDLSTAIATIVNHGRDIMVNCRRLGGIAAIASRRKYLAADLIEEVLMDHEGRGQEGGGKGVMVGGRQRGMHLQTADGRMAWWKARNWDLWAFVGGWMVVLGIVIALAKRVRG